MSLFKKECNHFYGPIDERNFQYCTKCGRAVQVFVECFHTWKTVESFVESDRISKIKKDYIWKQECTKCGEIKIVSMDVEKKKREEKE
jgi:hypothetical protein